MKTVFLLTGSNLGDRAAHLNQAARLITHRVGEVQATSGVYQTAPWGQQDQPEYLNQVLQVSTHLEAIQVLDTTQQIEEEMGRTRTQKWGPRLIDIDLLYMETICMQTERLTLPHPHIADRRFVLVPLCELAPVFVHPLLGQTNAELLAQCPDSLPVYAFCTQT